MSRHEVRAVLRKVYACYFLSGAVGLMYQILWLRKLLLVFGSTVHAVSTVLTVFFGGLALGSWLFGRLIDRREGAGLRWYAALEAGVGLYAFITLPLFDAIQRLYIPVYRASGFSPAVLVGASFVCSAAILLIPTTLLGGTFPLLSRYLIRSHEERGVKIASLYGFNTAGAMAGTLLVYYVGLPVLGLLRTLLCAGVLNLGIGMLCLAFDRHLESLGFRSSSSAPSATPVASREEPPGDLRTLFFAFGLSGFSAMVYEVAWTRALSLVVGSSTYAFCIMLATFLGGTAIGSFIARQHLRRSSGTIQQFVVIELVLGAYGLCSIPLFSQLPEWFVTLWPLMGQSFSTLSWLQFTLSSFVMTVPTLLMGVLFPVVSDIVTRRLAHLGRRLGSAYAINTLGGIAGSFLSGFVLIPVLGLPWAMVCAAMVNIVAASMVYVRLGQVGFFIRRVALMGASLVGAMVLSGFVVVPSWRRQVFAAGVYLNPEAYRDMSVLQGMAKSKLLYYRDSLNATVSVHQAGEVLLLKVGGKTDASTGIDMGTQVLSAHIPLLLHEDPKKVLVIGLGSGVTLGHASRYPVSTLHCAEIDPAVIEGARYFKDYNYHIHEDPRATIFVADGRNFLLAGPEQYDVIISEPSNPWMAGLAYLFTQEFYELAKRRLAPGGVMCQWLQVYGIFPSDVKLMLKTFHAAFPHVSVWSSVPGDLLLVGSLEPHQLEYRRLAERMASPAIKESLELVHVDRPETLLHLFWMGNRDVEQLTADISWLHEDDQPLVEFSAPKALHAGRVFWINYTGLEQFKSQPQSIAPDYDPTTEDAQFYRSLARLWAFREERGKEQKALEDAIALDPMSSEAWMRLGELSLKLNPLSAKEALTRTIQLDPTNVRAYRLLARLHQQQGLLKEAQRFYEQAAGLQAPDGSLAEELGDSLMETRELVRAVEYYRSSLSQGGGSRPALLIAYGKALKELQSWETAEQVLRFGMSAFPNESAFSLLLGETLLEQERWLDAEPWFQRTLAVTPKSAEACYGLGRIALGLGRTEQAVRYLKRGLQDNPYHREALKLLHQLKHPQG